MEVFAAKFLTNVVSQKIFNNWILCSFLIPINVLITADFPDDLLPSPGYRMVNGFDTRGPLPWQLLLYINKTAHNDTHIEHITDKCGGTLISAKFGISALHCFMVLKPRPVPSRIYLNESTVAAGLYFDSNLQIYERTAQFRRIQAVYAPWHDKPLLTLNGIIVATVSANIRPDFVVFELEEPFTITGSVMPACLPKKVLQPGTVCHASGWGMEHSNRLGLF